MTYKITSLIIIAAFFTGCVSPKVVDEIKAQRQETFKQNEEIKKDNIRLSTENTELNAKLLKLTAEVNQLVLDSIDRSKSCLQLQETLNDLNEAYDLLTAKNSQMMMAKANEAKKILQELQQARQDLLQKEDELLSLEQSLSVKQKELIQTQQELEDREKKSGRITIHYQ